jgi:hypothetical protein
MIKPKEFTKLVTKLGLAAGLLATALFGGHVFAADHAEAPGTMADAPADITDFYAWNTDAGTIVTIVNFAGLAEAGSDPVYDPEVLYGIHIDNTGDHMPDIDIWARFGQNQAGEWGLQVVNIPGADAAPDPDICGTATGHCGPVDTEIDTGAGTRIWAGPREDPFFFDLDGYLETLDTGMLSFDSMNDTFAGLNVTSIVVEMDAAAAAAGADNIQLWATTSRL